MFSCVFPAPIRTAFILVLLDIIVTFSFLWLFHSCCFAITCYTDSFLVPTLLIPCFVLLKTFSPSSIASLIKAVHAYVLKNTYIILFLFYIFVNFVIKKLPMFIKAYLFYGRTVFSAARETPDGLARRRLKVHM